VACYPQFFADTPACLCFPSACLRNVKGRTHESGGRVGRNSFSLLFYGFKMKRQERRVDRVLGFFSSRPNWNPPPPHPQASVSPPPFGSGGGGWGGAGDTLPCRRRGGGVPIRTRGQILWYSMYICTLWARSSMVHRRMNKNIAHCT
jgi:hypothetical protein